MTAFWRWSLGLGIAALVTVGPFIYYRWEYTHSKRLREVVPGWVLRSGQMTEEGFVEAQERYHFRTFINLQDDYPDPPIARGYFTLQTIRESELCKQLGIHYVHLAPDLVSHRLFPKKRPQAIDQFLSIMDDRANYPILIHCRAGLHRTGIMTAIYRMEYQGWSIQEAIQEVKANGFGEFACTSANDYISQYVLGYQPGIRMKLPTEMNP